MNGLNASPAAWLDRLNALAVRFSHLGVSADLAALSLTELWALYLFLSRLEGGGQ